ncbi:hypothetical protein OROHE_016011 [Orobanche hederae]
MAARNRARRKREDCDDGDDVFSWKIRAGTYGDLKRSYGREFVPIHILFECASGYALFLAPGISDVEIDKFQLVEEFINSSPFQLVDDQRFSSHAEALFELNAISTSTLTHKLKDFLERNLPHPRKNYKLATSDSDLGLAIARKLLVPVTSGLVIYDVMRGLRDKIHTFLHLDLGALEKAQLTLDRLYNNQSTTSPGLSSSSSYLQEQVAIVPHRCQSNLALRVQNEDRTEVEHPLRSKLGAAILSHFTNIWIKPGSRVLYAVDVCALTVFNLSDLVGSDGLVYVVGFSGGNDVVHMAGKRENIVTIEGKYRYCHWHYRMLVDMVDIVFGEIDHCPNHPPGQQHQYRGSLHKPISMDAARVLLFRFGQRFAATNDRHRSYRETINAFPAQHREVLERSQGFGPVPPIQYGEIFRFRFQLMLVGLHDDPIRGICATCGGVSYATCIVTKYPLHNFINEEGFPVIGVEGGGIAAGHRMGMRIIADQWLSRRNIGMRHSLQAESLVRLVCHEPLNAAQSRYTYQGEIIALDEEILLTPEGQIISQYVVNPTPLQVRKIVYID